jgi:hypothetical protein
VPYIWTQFVAMLPANSQEPLVVRGVSDWDTKPEKYSGMVVFTWPEIRRLGKVPYPKAKMTFQPDSLGYAGLVKEAQHRDAAAHRAKFEHQAEVAQEMRDAVTSLKTIRETLGIK